MTHSAGDAAHRYEDEYSYAQFGRDFFEYAVSAKRIENALSNLTGNKIDFGPREAGPAGLASIRANGEIHRPLVERKESDLVCFAVTIPIRLELVVRLAALNHRFQADLRAHLTLTARARKPLHLFIDIPAPSERDVEVEVKAQGRGASVLDSLADIDGELRRTVARQIAKEIDKPEIRAMRDIDVRARLDKKAPAEKQG